MNDNYPMGVDGSHDYFNQPDEVEAEIIDEESDAEKIKRLALAQALYKNIKEMVATGNEFNLRGEVDAIMAQRFAQAKKLGVAPKSFDIEIDGEKVGTYSITTTKAEPEKTKIELQTENAKELLNWALERGFVSVDMKAVEKHFADTGEVPDGCLVVPVVVPASQGGRISRTTLKIDPEKVSYSLGSNLGEMTEYLLGGGDE